MNYAAAPYNPSYAPAYDPNAYAQAQQQAAQLDQMVYTDPYGQQYPMVYTGQALPGSIIAATPANLTPLQAAWWQQNTYGIPRWGIAAGAAALTGIFLAHQAGVFGKMGGGRSRSSSRTTTRRTTSRDAGGGERDFMSGGGRRRKSAGTRRRKSASRSRRRR